MNRFTEAKDELDPIRKKEVVRVIFKEVLIKDRRVVSFELFDPFKSFLEGKELCRNKLLEELSANPLGCASSPSADRLARYTRLATDVIIIAYDFDAS